MEIPSLNGHRHSHINKDLYALDTDTTENGYHSQGSNTRSLNKDTFLQSQQFNSRQIYSNELPKQPKSHTDINCYQDISIQYNNRERLRRKKQFQNNHRPINQEQYSIKYISLTFNIM